MISFPKEGYTLALDFPVRDGLFDFLDELDKVVLQYGGRLYMSKDARMKPRFCERLSPAQRVQECSSTIQSARKNTFVAVGSIIFNKSLINPIHAHCSIVRRCIGYGSCYCT
jgi:hypothetical protein